MAYTTINKSTDYFNTKLYTGNGSTQSITGVGFQPDLTWIKGRSDASWHRLQDAVRGATKEIYSNGSNAEGTDANTLTSFNSDGFSLGTATDYNGNSRTQVAWNWKANGAGSANTDGSTNSTVSVNTTAGFSIVKYTGTGSQTTVGHGLGVVPDVMIIRNLSSTEDWSVYHSANGAGYYQALNTTEASSSNNNRFNVAPTSSVFTVNTHHSVNKSGDNHIAYCFAGKTGFSKFGSYKGNGNADGTFVYTGFKPSFVMIKEKSSSGYQWTIVDNKRSSSNSSSMKWLFPDSNGSETTESTWDLLSNGFKQRANHSYVNHSGTHIYMAFGQSLVGSNNVPCTAR